MRIGLFTDTYPPDINGVANSTFILRQQLLNLGHEVFVICPRKGLSWAKWNDDHTILGLGGIQLKQLYGYIMTSPFHANALNEIKTLRLDVIHSQQEFGVGIFARICARQLDIPLVTTFHTDYEDYTHYVNIVNSQTVDKNAKKAIGYLARIYGDSATRVIAPSQKTKKLLEKYGVKADISVVPTGLPLETFNPQNADAAMRKRIRQQYGIQEKERWGITVGRIASEKSVDVIIEGYHIAKQQGHLYKLMIVGGGPDVEKLQALVASYGMENQIIFTGPVPNESVKDYYHSGDYFVSASLSETQGMTFAEALASGLPLYCRYDSVLDNLLVDGVNGAFYQDANDLANMLEKIAVMDDDEFSAMGSKSIEMVQPISDVAFGKHVEEVYQKAIDTYQNMHIIEDIKIKDEVVQLFLTDVKHKNEDIRLLVPVEQYYSLGLRKGMHVSRALMQGIQDRQETIKAYQSCLRKLSLKDRTRKEMYDWLTRETDCSIESINGIIDKLETQGYINDERYCKEAIERMKHSYFGEERIIRELKKKGISLDMIQSTLTALPDDEQQNADVFAQKVALQIHDNSVRQKKKKIIERMLYKGYRYAEAQTAIEKLNFSQDEMEETNALRKIANKAKHRYERKYQGTKLRNTVFRYCASQGFQAEDIYAILDEMEWNEYDED